MVTTHVVHHDVYSGLGRAAGGCATSLDAVDISQSGGAGGAAGGAAAGGAAAGGAIAGGAAAGGGYSFAGHPPSAAGAGMMWHWAARRILWIGNASLLCLTSID